MQDICLEGLKDESEDEQKVSKLYSSGLRYGPLVGSCEQGNEALGSIKFWEILTK
jgi:hypothetical protein